MKVEDIKNICNLGTGTMGFSTALLFAKKGYNVRMFGRSEASVERGFANIKAALETYKENQLVTEAEIPQIIARIKGCTTLEEAAEGADFVIESIAEDLAVKKKFGPKLKHLRNHIQFLQQTLQGLVQQPLPKGYKEKKNLLLPIFGIRRILSH